MIIEDKSIRSLLLNINVANGNVDDGYYIYFVEWFKIWMTKYNSLLGYFQNS